MICLLSFFIFYFFYIDPRLYPIVCRIVTGMHCQLENDGPIRVLLAIRCSIIHLIDIKNINYMYNLMLV